MILSARFFSTMPSWRRLACSVAQPTMRSGIGYRRVGECTRTTARASWRCGWEYHSINSRQRRATARWSHSARARGKRSKIFMPPPCSTAELAKAPRACARTTIRIFMQPMYVIRTAINLPQCAAVFEINDRGRLLVGADDPGGCAGGRAEPGRWRLELLEAQMLDGRGMCRREREKGAY